MMKDNKFGKDFSITESIIYQIEPDFVAFLTKYFKELTEDETKICVLRKNGFSLSEIAKYMMLTKYESVKIVKNLSKKLKQNYNIEFKQLLQKHIPGGLQNEI